MPEPGGASTSEVVFCQSEDGRSRIKVHLDGGTVWLNQVLLAELFQTTKQNISLHVKNIFAEGELDPSSTVKQYLTVQTEGSRRAQCASDPKSTAEVEGPTSRSRRGGRGAAPSFLLPLSRS